MRRSRRYSRREKDVKRIRVNFRLPEELVADLDRAAGKFGDISRTALVTLLIKKSLPSVI